MYNKCTKDAACAVVISNWNFPSERMAFQLNLTGESGVGLLAPLGPLGAAAHLAVL